MQRINHMTDWLSRRIASSSQQYHALMADDRADEAVFERIKGNVYDIFRTVLDVAVQRSQDPSEIRQFFLERIQRIPANWKASLTQASEYGDAKKQHIEGIKLATAAEIQEKFSSLWEGSL